MGDLLDEQGKQSAQKIERLWRQICRARSSGCD
jgi:hypothetical protein